MDLSRFVGNVSKHLICSICLNVFFDPVQDSDDHIFCRKCIETWILKNFTCPIDRKRLTVQDMKQSRTVKNLLDELEITCEYKANGCQKIVKWELLQKHKEECDFNPTKTIICPHGCDLMMQISKLKEHSCVSELKNECKKLQKQIDTCNQEWKKAFQMLQAQFQNEIKKLNNTDSKNEIKFEVPKILNNQLVATANNNNNKSFKLNGKFTPLIDEDTLVGVNGEERKIFIAYQNVALHFDQKYSFEELRYYCNKQNK